MISASSAAWSVEGRVTWRSSGGDVADLGQSPIHTMEIAQQGATGIVEGVLVVHGDHRLRVGVVTDDHRTVDHRGVLPVYNGDVRPWISRIYLTQVTPQRSARPQ